MTSVRRGRAAAEGGSPGDAAAGPAVMETRRERAPQAALDAVRLPLTALVRAEAERRARQPAQVGLAAPCP